AVGPPGVRVMRPARGWYGAGDGAARKLRPRELMPGIPAVPGPEVRVAPGVIAELADAGRGARPRLPGADTVADVEKRRPRVLITDHAHEPERVRARPVVEGEREAPAVCPRAVHGLRGLDQARDSREGCRRRHRR